jgi:copper chaperone
MITFQVNDMTCNHCVGSVTQAVKAADPGAQVRIDLASHRVEVQPASASAQALREAIAEAGYTPVPLAA